MSAIHGELGMNAGLTIWEGFELLLPGQTLRFHAGTNGYNANVIWQGNTYTAWPLQGTDFAVSGNNGAPPRPKLVVGNFGGAISALCRQFDDLLGAKLIRRRTLAKYLDAVNFPDGNPTANAGEEYQPQTWIVTRKVNEAPAVVEFELGSPLDVSGVALPRRQAIASTCMWRYRSGECGYAGGPVADVFDTPTSQASLDQCSHTLRGCRARFGGGELPFGGFPGLNKVPRL